MTSVYWLIAFVILIGIEIATMALTTIWFAGGAFVAFLLSLLNVSVEIQLLAFVVCSFLLLFLTRPFATKYVNRNTVKTNVDSLIGMKVRVTVEINNQLETGAALVNGQEWTARALKEDEVFQEGTMVEIRSIVGVKLIVTQEQEEA